MLFDKIYERDSNCSSKERNDEMLYEKPKMELMVFEKTNDVITTSGGGVNIEGDGTGNDHQFGS